MSPPWGQGFKGGSHEDKVRVDGKQFSLGGSPFPFRGVSYGTFRPREDGARFPERDMVKRDFSAMREAGFTVVRTYTSPPDDVVELAADWDLRLMVDVFYPDWRYLVDTSRRQRRAVAREAASTVRAAARRLAGIDHVMALSLGNEVPADVLRWLGTTPVSRVIDNLAMIVREEDPSQLVTYANYPTAEYLTLDNLDFLTFNIFLERRNDLRKYLTRLHHLAGDRPLVLGEVGFNAGEGDQAGEQQQAEVLDWQLATAVERGVAGMCVFSWTDEWWVGDAEVRGWHFGLTRADRSPRPALDVAARWNCRTVADLDMRWPPISVVICAYNAEATLEECLRVTCTLDYPKLEIIVVDDGSTDATPNIARRFPEVRLLTIPHGGLSVARNEGFRAARGEVVAYLDSDAFPSPDWPYYLVLGFDEDMVGGVGGPNVPPAEDPLGAHVVARAPGGPVHVLLSDDRAEHIPGCNMAFWTQTLEDVGGFDPVFTSAGDDVDLCWRVLDRGWDIGFHPAALVWHHRRASTRAYLRQQRSYGRSETLVQARHPGRFTGLGTARWRGRIYNSLTPRLGQRIYRGLYGAAAYQSVYRGGGYALDVAHQLGVPLAALAIASSPVVALWHPWLWPVAVAAATLIALLAIDVSRAKPPASLVRGRLRFRCQVAALNALQPLVRTWGRMANRRVARKDIPGADPLPAGIQRSGRGVLMMPEDRSRADLAGALIAHLRRAGTRVIPACGWEDYDARVVGSSFLYGDLITSSHPIGCVQLRVRRRVRRILTPVAAFAMVALLVISPPAGAIVVIAGFLEIGRGMWHTGPRIRRVVRAAESAEVTA